MTSFRLAGLCLLLPVVVVAADPPVEAKTSRKLEILNKQVEANPENAQAYSNRGYTLALLGRKEEARADLKKALELNSKAPMHNGAGWSYFNMGDYADALREFETAAKLSDCQSHYDYYSLVLGYWGVKDTQKALENYQLAAKRDPRFADEKTLDERIKTWQTVEKQAMHEIYALWVKAGKP